MNEDGIFYTLGRDGGGGGGAKSSSMSGIFRDRLGYSGIIWDRLRKYVSLRQGCGDIQAIARAVGHPASTSGGVAERKYRLGGCATCFVFLFR